MPQICNGQSSNRLNPITAIPTTTPEMEIWCLPYFSADGNSSSKEIKTMMPETAAKIIPLIVVFQ